jgi:F-type H+-transporting ATPase subunit b
MRMLQRSAALAAALTLTASTLQAQGEHAAEGPVNLLAPEGGLMFWTLIIFGILSLVLWRYAWPPLLQSVEARERALREALESAARDRAEAQRILADHTAKLDAARGEAQKIIADGRTAAEKIRTQMLDETKKQQDELLTRARRDIDGEKAKAIAELRREAVDLALLGASKVIERNLDDATNRRMVDDFLNSVKKG